MAAGRLMRCLAAPDAATVGSGGERLRQWVVPRGTPD